MNEMNLSRRLAAVLERSHSLEDILRVATEAVARRVACDACWALLVDPDERSLRVRGAFARTGTPSSFADAAALDALAVRAVSGGEPAAGGEPPGLLLAVPLLLRGRPVGALVVQGRTGGTLGAEQTAALVEAAAQLVGPVENALLVETLDRGAPPARLLLPASAAGARDRGEVVMHGVAASPGIGIGVASIRSVDALSPAVREAPPRGVEEERASLRDALVKTRNDIVKLQEAAAHDIDEEHALIFSSHLLLLNDPQLTARMDAAVAAGRSAAVAIDEVLTELGSQLRGVPDAYLQERAEDIGDLRGRLISHVLHTGAPERAGGRVLVTRSIPPSLVVELKVQRAQGIVAVTGGLTSHGVLLARALGIPTVTGVRDPETIGPTDSVIVDGATGRVVVRPGDAARRDYENEARRLEQARTEHAKYRDQPLRSADGVRVTMLANVAVASDLQAALDAGAEGVGLYRTEFPFIVREHFPTRDEQVRIYRKAYEAFPRGPIHFRVLDLGGDKFLPGGSSFGARDAFHGYRGIRVLFDHPHVLRDQVQAFRIAAEGAPLSILIPMVTSIEELRRAKALIRDAVGALPGGAREPPLVGAMIEVPAAVEIAFEIAREVDYLSIGTNDLTQYALVVDRADSRMTSRADAYHPAVLRMVRRTIRAARDAGRPVSVCGEMAARPDLAALLAALRVDALSVVPTAIAELKQAMARVSIGPLAAGVDDVLSCADARGVEAALRRHLAPSEPRGSPGGAFG